MGGKARRRDGFQQVWISAMNKLSSDLDRDVPVAKSQDAAPQMVLGFKDRDCHPLPGQLPSRRQSGNAAANNRHGVQATVVQLAGCQRGCASRTRARKLRRVGLLQ